MAIQASEISAILKDQIKNFGQEAEVAEVGRVLSVGDGIARVYACILFYARLMLSNYLQNNIYICHILILALLSGRNTCLINIYLMMGI